MVVCGAWRSLVSDAWVFAAYAMQGSEVTVPDVTDMTQETRLQH